MVIKEVGCKGVGWNNLVQNVDYLPALVSPNESSNSLRGGEFPKKPSDIPKRGLFSLQTSDSKECKRVKFAIERKERGVRKWFLYCRDIKSVSQIRCVGRGRRLRSQNASRRSGPEPLEVYRHMCMLFHPDQDRNSWFIPPPRPLTVVRDVFHLVSVSDLKISCAFQMSEHVFYVLRSLYINNNL
jgi:hypothetical protein